MTYRHLFRLLSLTLLVAVTTACSSTDDAVVDTPAASRGIPFTATISTGGDDTRTSLKQETNGSISVKWTKSDRVALVYKVFDRPIDSANTTMNLTKTIVTEATVTPKNDGSGKATITATLDSRVKGGTAVTLIYPYSAVNPETGEIKNNFLSEQECALNGTTESIAAKYDLRRGTGTVTLSTGSATLSSDVTMASQICIWKLTLHIIIDGVIQPSNTVGQTISLTCGERTYTLRKRADVQIGGSTTYRNFKHGDVLYVALLPATSSQLSVASTTGDDTYRYTKEDVTLAAGKFYQSTLTLKKSNISLIGDVFLADGDVVTGTGGTNTHITIAAGSRVKLAGLTNTDNISGFAGIECLGDAHIFLEGENSVKGDAHCAGISVPGGKTLTISGDGSLTATGGTYAAGIGGDKDQPCGHIRIMGGTITATGGTAAAGIGGGFNGSFDGVTISNGITRVTAKKGDTGGYQVPLGWGDCDQGNGSVTIGSQTLTYQQQRNEGGLPTFLRFNIVGSGWDGHSNTTITITPKN